MWMSSYIAESSRDVAKDIAKDSIRASAAGILSPDTVFQGQIRNLVKADRSKYSKIRRSSHSFLHKILYCQSGISNEIANSSSSSSSSSSSFSSGSRGINPKSIINHEFLVIVMKIRGKRHIFLAEKCGSGANCGINIRGVKDAEMGVLEEAQVSAFDCEDTPMNLEQMLAILEDHDPNYAAREKNCWEYAVQTTQRLLMACQGVTGKVHFGEQAKLVGAKVTVNHVREMTARGIQVLLDVLSR